MLERLFNSQLWFGRSSLVGPRSYRETVLVNRWSRALKARGSECIFQILIKKKSSEYGSGKRDVNRLVGRSGWARREKLNSGVQNIYIPLNINLTNGYRMRSAQRADMLCTMRCSSKILYRSACLYDRKQSCASLCFNGKLLDMNVQTFQLTKALNRQHASSRHPSRCQYPSDCSS